MQDTVEWRKIKDFPNYSVSNYGEVRNDRKNTYMGYSFDAKGYYRVALSKNNKRYARRVHRLVAQAFLPNPENKEQVNHLDGNKLNNRVCNLEWCTNQENQDHYWKYLDNGSRGQNISKGLKETYRKNPELAEQKRKYMSGRKVSEETKHKLGKKVIRLEDKKIYFSIIYFVTFLRYSYPIRQRRQFFLSQYSFFSWMSACESPAFLTVSPHSRQRRIM